VLLLEVATVASSNSSPPLRGSGPTATSGQPSSAARGTTRAKWKPRHRHRRHRHHQPRSCRRYRCRPTAPIAVAAPLWHVLVWCSWLRRTGPRLRPQAAKSPARWAFFRWGLRNASVGVGWAGHRSAFVRIGHVFCRTSLPAVRGSEVKPPKSSVVLRYGHTGRSRALL